MVKSTGTAFKKIKEIWNPLQIDEGLLFRRWMRFILYGSTMGEHLAEYKEPSVSLCCPKKK